MVQICDNIIRKIAIAVAENNPIQVLYALFDEINIGKEYYEAHTTTRDNLTVTLLIKRTDTLKDFVELARTLEIDPLIDNLRYEQKDTTIDHLTVREMLENYEELKSWLYKATEIIIACVTTAKRCDEITLTVRENEDER